MKRLVIQPRVFGSVNGYEWDPDSAPKAHNDYCQLYYSEYSTRVWEPTRMTTSTPGVAGGTFGYESTAIATKAHIRGIKGEAHFRFDGTEQGVGVVLDEDGVPWAQQPTPAQIYSALAGVPSMPALDSPFPSLDWNPGFYIPLFCAMYRGTFKSIDNAPGWEIDTGPGDDPDVLLPLDITSPDVLESGRLDWWALDQVRLPHSALQREYTTNVGGGNLGMVNSAGFPRSGSHHRFALNLDANKRVASNQVLWLHWKTGVVRLPFLGSPSATGTPEVQCGLYVNHRFNAYVHATMLVDTAVSL